MVNNSQTYNVTDIWKGVYDIGSTTYINVTDGTKRVVPWGTLDWIGAIVGWTGVSALLYAAAKFFFKF